MGQEASTSLHMQQSSDCWMVITDFSFFLFVSLFLYPKDRANFLSSCKRTYGLRDYYPVFLGGNLHTDMLLQKEALLNLFASQFGLSHNALITNFYNQGSLSTPGVRPNRVFRGFVMDQADQVISNKDAKQLFALALLVSPNHEDPTRKIDEDSILHNRKRPAPDTRTRLVFDEGIFKHHFPHLRSLLLENVSICQPLSYLALRSPLLEIFKIKNCTIGDNPGFGSSFRRLDHLKELGLILKSCNSTVWGLLLLPIKLKSFHFVIHESCSVTIDASSCTQLRIV
jgi:hypothetical protein